MFNDLCLQTHDELIKMSKGKKIVLWGKCRDLALEAIEKYSNIGYMVDSNCEKWGDGYKGIKVYSPSKLYTENPEDTVILVTSGPNHVYEITEQIKKIDNFKIFYFHVLIKPWFNTFSVDLYNNLNKIKNCIKMMDDDESRKVLSEVVKRRIMGSSNEYDDLRIQGERQYLSDIIYKTKKDEVIVDCGAYIGDTAKRFVEKFGNKVKKIYSYEALPKNIEKLNTQQLKFQEEYNWTGKLIVYPFAVSDKKTILQFWETEQLEGSFIPDLRSTANLQINKKVDSFQVETCSIDETIPENENVTLIKMDIEGAEYQAIVGAEKTIKKNKPRCAISIYHNPLDYTDILELLKSYVPEYKFAVRHYKTRHVDTVLYAWTEE